MKLQIISQSHYCKADVPWTKDDILIERVKHEDRINHIGQINFPPMTTGYPKMRLNWITESIINYVTP